MASGRRECAERPGAAAAAATAATAFSASDRGSSSGVGSLPWLLTCQLDKFCLGAVEHPDNSARLREPSHRALRPLAGEINKVNGEQTWRSRPTVRVRSGSTEFLALADSGASHTVMRFDTFQKISSSNKEISDTGIGLTPANDQPLARKGTFLVKLDAEGLGRITHHVIVVEQLAWPLLLGYDALAIYGAKIDAGRGTVSWDWEGARRCAEVLSKSTFPPIAWIIKGRIGQKRRVDTAFTLDCGHLNVVSGLYYVNRQGETYVCLVNETADEAVIGDKKLLGEHIPTAAGDTITLGELLTVKSESPSQETRPSDQKLKVIDDTIKGQTHLTGEQKEQLWQVLVCQHEAVSLGKSDMGRSSAVPHLLRPKSEEPVYVKQFPIPAAHLHFINEQIDKLLALGAIGEDWVSPHNSPVFAVKKPHSDMLRFVIDTRKVNKIFWDDFHLFMDVTSCLPTPKGIGNQVLISPGSGRQRVLATRVGGGESAVHSFYSSRQRKVCVDSHTHGIEDDLVCIFAIDGICISRIPQRCHLSRRRPHREWHLGQPHAASRPGVGTDETTKI